MNNQINILEEYRLSESLLLKNRIIMAAMTRNRADNGVPSTLMKVYYTQRADDCGFLITECMAVSKQGNCYSKNGNCYVY